MPVLDVDGGATMRAIRAARSAATAGVLTALALALGACATPAPGISPSAAPPPGAGDLLTTSYPVTVLDDGDGAELCLGGVMESLPPQCGGPVIVGWDWAEHTDAFEEASGVRWGEFLVTGTYDPAADEFTPADIVPAADAEWPSAPAGYDFST